MGKGDMARMYKYMSAEDQRKFDRWLKANTIISLIFATGLIAMAFAGSTAVGLREEAVAANASGDCTVSSCLEKVQIREVRRPARPCAAFAYGKCAEQNF